MLDAIADAGVVVDAGVAGDGQEGDVVDVAAATGGALSWPEYA